MLLSTQGYANMAEPPRNVAPFTSKHTDILNERIVVTLDQYFNTADFDVTYHIETDSAGMQIPMVFLALGHFKQDFKVNVDDSALTTITGYDPLLFNFKGFNKVITPERETEISIRWPKGETETCYPEELRYFKINLTKGKHTIRVTYQAFSWDRNYMGLIPERRFYYSLEPAKEWKSFGALEIEINNSQFHLPITTDLGVPAKGHTDSVAVWEFKNLPQDGFEIQFEYKLGILTRALIFIGPLKFSLLLTLLFIFFHIRSIRNRRKRRLLKSRSLIMLGSMLIPLLFALSCLVCYSIIESSVVDQLSPANGFFYYIIENVRGVKYSAALTLISLIILAYMFIIFQIDIYFKKKYKTN